MTTTHCPECHRPVRPTERPQLQHAEGCRIYMQNRHKTHSKLKRFSHSMDGPKALRELLRFDR